MNRSPLESRSRFTNVSHLQWGDDGGNFISTWKKRREIYSTKKVWRNKFLYSSSLLAKIRAQRHNGGYCDEAPCADSWMTVEWAFKLHTLKDDVVRCHQMKYTRCVTLWHCLCGNLSDEYISYVADVYHSTPFSTFDESVMLELQVRRFRQKRLIGSMQNLLAVSITIKRKVHNHDL